MSDETTTTTTTTRMIPAAAARSMGARPRLPLELALPVQSLLFFSLQPFALVRVDLHELSLAPIKSAGILPVRQTGARSYSSDSSA